MYISQLVRIGRICERYEDFRERHHKLTTRLLKQGYKYDQLCLDFKKFNGKYKDIVNKFQWRIQGKNRVVSIEPVKRPIVSSARSAQFFFVFKCLCCHLTQLTQQHNIKAAARVNCLAIYSSTHVAPPSTAYVYISLRALTRLHKPEAW